MSQTVLITGASGGIGQAVSRAFAEKGNRLFLAGNTNTAALAALQKELLSYSVSCEYIACDLSSGEGVRALFAAFLQHYDAPDVVVNNAGAAEFGQIQDADEETLQRVMNTDLASVIRVCREASKLMIPRHCGRIINVSSVFGIYGASCESLYSAAKGAVNAFTKSLAKELAPSGIAVNAIAPGAVDTSMNARLSTEERAALETEIPAGRFGTPEEIAECIRLLAAAPVYLTGQVIAADGGWF